MTTTGHPDTPIPDAFTRVRGSTQLEPMGSSTIADELPLYAVHLQAENKSRATVSLWTGQPGNCTPTLSTTACPPTCGPFGGST